MSDPLIDLRGKVALVTGAGAGIGREIARWLARAGCDVAVDDIDLGRLDVAVNNAGMLGDAAQSEFADLQANDIRAVIERNLLATTLCCVAEARTLLAQDEGGVILNVTSGETTRPALRLAVYGAAKAGINHLTQTMAAELGPNGIRVLAIAPGTTLTEQVRAVFDDAHVAALEASLPLRRMTEPEELGRLAAFLASDLARAITGQLFLADAGAHLSRTRPPIAHGPKTD